MTKYVRDTYAMDTLFDTLMLDHIVTVWSPTSYIKP